MRKAFTLVEVIILLVIFIMVALLAIPLSIDDTIQAKHISKWKQVQNGFIEIPTSIRTFSQSQKMRAYEKQKHRCPYCQKNGITYDR